MKVVFSHTTALDLLRAYRAGAPIIPVRTRATSLADSAHTWNQITAIAIPSFSREDTRIHVLVDRPASLCDSSRHVCHLQSYPLLEGSLLRITEEVFTVTPKLLFAQMAVASNLPELLLLGAELCGGFTLFENGMHASKPCTSVKKLERYLTATASVVRGANKALKALRWVPDNAASPMEAALYYLLHLPVKMGGYGFPRPQMNPTTILSEKNAKAMGVGQLRCDLHWTEAHVGCEYNSSMYHEWTLTHDARRANALTSEGERIFAVTPRIIADPELCDVFAEQLARAMGHRLRGNALHGNAKRNTLRHALLPWVADGQKVRVAREA